VVVAEPQPTDSAPTPQPPPSEPENDDPAGALQGVGAASDNNCRVDEFGLTAGAGDWTVQVASYLAKSDADAMVQHLRESCVRAFSVAAEVDGKTWHRVWVGQFRSRAEAEGSVAELKQHTTYEPFATRLQ